MTRALLTTALVTPLLVLSLAACGGTRDSATDGPTDEQSGSSGATTAPSSAPSSAAPQTPASPAACPLTAQSAAPPAGVSADLTQKPTAPGQTAPPPTSVTVADVVVGTGQEATTGSQVSLKYVGELYESGTEFDSSWKQSPDTTFDTTVCGQETVPGFSIAPTGMKVGGRRVVTIPAQYGYGAQGSPPTIPANATLVFIIDLVKVTPAAG